MDRQKFDEQTFVIVHKGLESGHGANVWEGNWLGGCAGGHMSVSFSQDHCAVVIIYNCKVPQHTQHNAPLVMVLTTRRSMGKIHQQSGATY